MGDFKMSDWKWTSETSPESVLNIKQLAEALQVTEQHLYRELRLPECKIPHHKIGNAKRFLLSEVLKATKNEKEERK